jgi:hypothetical protein
MRRLTLSLLLPLLMLLAQQGAAWHEIGHWSQSSSPQDQQRKPKQDHAGKLCESCLAFAGLAVGVQGDPPTLSLASFSHVLSASVAGNSTAAPAPAARSRGPPRPL